MQQANRVPQQLGVNVVGDGTVNVVPDLIALTVGIESSGESAVQALDSTNKCILGVIEALRHKGVNQNDMRTVWVGIYPLYAHVGEVQGAAAGAYSPYYAQNYTQTTQTPYTQINMYPQNLQAAAQTPGAYAQNLQTANAGAGMRPLAFAASVWLTISLREVNRTGEILDAAFSAGAGYCGGQSFGLQDESAARRAALDAASKDAQAKAQILAASMGIQLGKLLTIVEEYTVQSMGLPRSSIGSQMTGMSTGTNAGAITTSPGELIFTSRVRVTYG